MNRIDGKIALVTGGTQGLGAAIAHTFARAGAAGIAIVGRGADKGRKVAAAIEAETQVPVQVIAADLGNIDDVRRIVPEADARFGRVDILVNAAGLTDRGNLLNTTPELFDRMFAVNVRAPFFLMQDAVNVMERVGVEGRDRQHRLHLAERWPAVHRGLLRLQGGAGHADPQLWLCADAQPNSGQPVGHRLDGL